MYLKSGIRIRRGVRVMDGAWRAATYAHETGCSVDTCPFITTFRLASALLEGKNSG